VLVFHDLLGFEERIAPRFVRRYAQLGRYAREALARFAADVRSGEFPGAAESYEDPAHPFEAPRVERLYGS
jgi:3-methyl-2-oxobutanoate hydroxymethyltransferase